MMQVLKEVLGRRGPASPPDETTIATRAVQLLGALYEHDVRTSEPVTEEYGGAYELAMISGAGFQKLGPFLHCFWKHRVEGNAFIFDLAPHRVVYQTYVNEALICRSLKTGSRRGSLAVDLEEDMAIAVLPMHEARSIDVESALRASKAFEPEVVLNHHVVALGDGSEAQVFSDYTGTKYAQPGIRICSEKNDYTFEVDHSYLLSIAERVKEEIIDRGVK